ncbi:hypothetical protein A2W54_04160 [Candidatus Giovannonibacteria bacterium RIFCSPHIGHO2_02_43_13]|uniref:Endolytic murein transglycosylase n=1 Tax=Candidatus Giovannonibacteria bacterium RIFCSPHIGHO2_02_43_13 TaxID=1798330 RepID=A0A1F5WT44_9BACT|nr:MAG: hypothetical protein A2W54_04160 [Candidatus Giovannonibacteria bacterium RIFCSPHIGHO2_02_43_13]
MDEHVNVKTIILQLAALFAALGVIYLFLRLPDIASRKEREIVELKEITVTVPEGVNIRQIGEIFEKNGMFSKKVFLGAAESDEGYLFPDTYRFYKDATPQDAVLKMKENFLKKITPDILGEIAAQKKTLDEIIIMASILEEEVKSTEDRKIVSEILWKRLKLGMGLNVDSALTYVLGKISAELTASDLKYDSRYNTYRYRGLPPTPISNPGMDAILAAMNPATTKYFYYLTGKDGKTYYAETLEKHALNKRKYLR